MANIELLKKLRDLTQAGMSDALKALKESNDDLELSVQWLREKGIAKAAKKANAIATEGIAQVYIKDNLAVIFEVNCETDFVSTNSEFVSLTEEIGELLIESGEYNIENFVKLKFSNGETVEDACKSLTGKIGEKIALRRYEIFSKNDEQMFSFYQHSNKKIAVLLVIDKQIDSIVGKDIAMHAAAMSPKYLNENNVEKEWLENEVKIIKEQMTTDPKFVAMMNDSKASLRIEGIIKGKVNKLLSEVTLEAQVFVKDSSKTVKQHVNQNGGNLLTYVRYQVGEGIEKKVVDFAEEVASQMNNI
ncbi:MAG: translation elongation factor Ts [Mycoplasmataceae bacterium]|nr:translation elongation factor Ts [Mycoplasmataceae bacterium]